MTRPAVDDQAERDRLVRELDRTLFVEAGAGTGKTAALVTAIAARVAAGRLRMERLVAITFTVAAAGELRVRIREALEERAADVAVAAEVRARLRQAASEVDRARIETIHAFCAALLRMHPLEAGLPPDFETLAELAGDIDVEERFRRWFDSLRPGEPGGEAVRRGLLLGLRPDQLLQLLRQVNANWDLVEGAAWSGKRAPVLARAPVLGKDVQRCIDLLPLCRAPDALHQHVDALRLVAARLLEARDEDSALTALVELCRTPKLGGAGQQANWDPVDGVNACAAIRQTMKAVREEGDALLGAARTAAMSAIAGELRAAALSYAEERRRRGVVTYHDLLVRARNLVRDDPDVARALRARWDLIAVDEFQDTDPLQAELVFRLCAENGTGAEWRDLPLAPGRLCVVGDPKQSIYRFRRADIALYSAVEGNLLAADPLARARLSVNFRSGRRIVEVVNAVFGGPGGLMHRHGAAAGVQPAYVELAPHAPEVEGRVAVFGGPVEGPAGGMWRREAEATAAVVRRIRDEGWRVGEGSDRGARPCTLEDVCILMPARTNLRNLERELERARIRYRLESGSLIIATQEVRDLLNILRAIDDPTDEVALVAALRSPGYGCDDGGLVRWKAGGGRWSYERPGDGAEPRVRGALEELRELHERRHEWSVAGLVEEVVCRRLLRALAHDDWRPQEAQRRYRFVAEQARALARSGRPTLHDTVDHLERLARDPVYDSVVSEGPSEEPAVRVMTVHAAKGLEFPIVVVTGLGRKPRPSGTAILVDHDSHRVELRVGGFATAGWEALAAREKAMEAAEQVRLLYVALTRPRDHLVVSLFRALRRGEETDAGRLDGLVRGRGDVDVLEDRWEGAAAEGEPRVSPDGTTAEEHRAAETAWAHRRAELLATLGGLRMQTATGLAHAEGEEGLAPELKEEVAASRRGRAATSLGRAVHAVLQVVDLETGEGLEDVARVQAAAEGIPPERAGDVAALARAAWRSEPVRRAAGSRHWREVPVGATVDGVLLEGFVDLLYELPDGRLVVVDYKTDAVSGAEVDRRMERYRVQGGVYALLVSQVTGREVARIELVFAAPDQVRRIDPGGAAAAEARARLGGIG
jgi:ATP-dependent helicase/nuclease subunit A